MNKRYVTENDVKRALKIDSFRNLSKDKVMEFASMIPDMDKDVAIAIINQFPSYADFGKTAISKYMEVCNKLLDNNKESQSSAIYSYQSVLDTLSKRMETACNTEEERKAITEDMITVADKIAELDQKNKQFLKDMTNRVICGIAIAVCAIGAALGVKSSINGSNTLPQVSDNNDNYAA